jgi:hypothetical protein
MFPAEIPTKIRRFFTSREGASAAETAAGNATRRSRRRRPALEALEGRALLSGEFLVSHNPQGANYDTDNASSSNGTSVVVWVNDSATDSDIWAQRIDKTGHLTGSPIQVDVTGADSDRPHVSISGNGKFVVTWQDSNTDGTTSVMMRYFSAAGSPLTGITQVSDAGSQDYSPDVAASNGSLVITWAHAHSSTDDDIYAERYVISGGVPTSPTRIDVNTDGNVENAPSVAMSPDGRFDIVYERQFSSNSSNWDILGSQYDKNGTLLHGAVHINYDTKPEYESSVSMDNAGNAVVAYAEFVGIDDGIYANRWSSSNVVSSKINVHNTFGIDERFPSVALAPTGGQFVVAYNTNDGFQATEIDANNKHVTTFGPVDGSGPAMSVDGSGHWLVTYERSNSSSGHLDIFGRRDFL